MSDNARSTELAHDLAYQFAKSVIQSECAMCSGKDLPGREGWFNLDDTIQISEDGLQKSVEFLELNGLLDRHDAYPNLIRVREMAAAEVQA